MGFEGYEIANIKGNLMVMMKGPIACMGEVLAHRSHWAPGDARGSQSLFSSQTLLDAVLKLPDSEEKSDVVQTLLNNPRLEGL
ncbi:hypothetical protein [Sansalvadorimonas verongulae]|uniref:hypothetical protein n=1 Tax=Sansalvadorimonas verongulae TaxID=2172824 RepID=UPI0012BB83C9|nr:hypothetical protein [Sansalvadorimonas verongulae]MTI12618.1 hypothetical protein [Sansalvadorimonas verongulae]